MSWNMSAAPQSSGPPATLVMREPPQYSEFIFKQTQDAYGFNRMTLLFLSVPVETNELEWNREIRNQREAGSFHMNSYKIKKFNLISRAKMLCLFGQ